MVRLEMLPATGSSCFFVGFPWIYHAQNHRIIKVGIDLWDNEVQPPAHPNEKAEHNEVQQGQVQGVALGPGQSQVFIQTGKSPWEQPCGEGFGGSWWTRSWTWASSARLQPRRPTVFWAALKKGVASMERERWLSLCAQLLWGPIWSTSTRPGASSTRKAQNSWYKSRGGPLRWSEGCSTSATKKGWGNWACGAWKREGSRETSVWPSSTWREHINRSGIDCLHGLIVIREGGIVLN